MQSAGDHEVQHQRQLVLQLKDDALADPPHALHLFAEARLQRRRGRAQQEHTGDAHALERLTHDAGFELLHVDGQIR